MGIGPRLVAAGLAWSALAAFVPAGAAEAIGLTPHRAVYDITLVDARPGAGISELTGRMVYEFTGAACSGFTQKMRFVTSTTNQEGETSITDMRTSSWEDAAGDRFRFENSQYRNQQRVEQTVGEAVRRKTEIRVELKQPKKKTIKLPNAAIFPIQHSSRMLEAAREGKHIFTTDLFDASEKGEKVYATNAYIGSRLPPGYNKQLPEVPGADVLNELPAWPVALSYYEKGTEQEDALPAYELSFIYFDNGVSRRLLIDYGNFSIRGELKELTILEPEPCASSQSSGRKTN
ncbi:MAG TPA: cell envelope integrity EipB family protein [Hyphomicrobiaceae bacterium]|jgi:hypothetical protein